MKKPELKYIVVCSSLNNKHHRYRYAYSLKEARSFVKDKIESHPVTYIWKCLGFERTKF